MSYSRSKSLARRLPPLPQISDIIQLYNLSAKSQLSQNFLLDLNITDKLVKVAGRVQGCCVCEVGPGPGSLTRSILNAGVKRLIAVERDSRFLPSLELLRDFSGGRLEVHHADALKFDIAGSCSGHVVSKKWDEDPPNMHIIGNLPFNVSIPLLIQWLSMISKRQGPFRFGRSSLTLTFQKEVAEVTMAAMFSVRAVLSMCNYSNFSLSETAVMRESAYRGPRVIAPEEIAALCRADTSEPIASARLPFVSADVSTCDKEDQGQFQGPASQVVGTHSQTRYSAADSPQRIVADVSDHQRSRPSIMTQNYCEVKWGFVIGSKCFVPQPKVEAVVLKLTPLVKPVVDVDFNTFETVVRLMFRYRRKYVKKGTMLLFPECSEEDQKKLVQELLEESGVAGNMRAQELSVQQFGTVALNYSKYLTTNTNTSKAKSVGLL